MKFFPSYLASFFYGFFGIPIFIIGLTFIQEKYDRDLSTIILILWTIIVFFVPLHFALINRKYVKERSKDIRESPIENLSSKKNSDEPLPACKRLLVLILSASISIGLIELLL